MKKTIRPLWVYASMLVIGSTFSLTSCSSDDDKGGDIITTDVMYGKYEGTMNILEPAAEGRADDSDNGGGTAEINVSATINNDTVYFDDFPAKEIIHSVIKDEETADKISEAIGQTSYRIGYVPLMAASKDSINLTLNPEPLVLDISIPSTTEEEAQTLHVTVQIDAADNAVYSIGDKNAHFGIAATGVSIDNGGEQIPVTNFKEINLAFDMDQTLVVHHGR